jgi:hypothetical protein
MASNIRYVDRLEGISKYLQWKVMIVVVLRENKLMEFCEYNSDCAFVRSHCCYPRYLGITRRSCLEAHRS